MRDQSVSTAGALVSRALPRLPESTEARTFAEIGADRLELQAKLSAARLRILADECGQPAVAYLLRFEAVRLDRARGVRL